MPTKSLRKKQPELVRQRILEQAIMLAAQQGVAGVSIQQVANLVGVTKGGVFHHFANKHSLIEAMMVEVLQCIDHATEKLIADDPEPYGKFTRAYIQIAFEPQIAGLVSPWSALAMTMLTDPLFNRYWEQWLTQKLQQYQATDVDLELKFIRLAADGLWLNHMTEVENTESTQQLKRALLQRTYPRVKNQLALRFQAGFAFKLNRK